MAQHWTITARSDERAEAPCAIVPAASREGAIIAAKALRDSGALSFVAHGSRFSLRPSSRAEMSMMQAFMASLAPGPAERLGGSDADAVVSRRQRLLMSFFIALHLDPDGLRRRLRSGGWAPRPTSPAGGGSPTSGPGAGAMHVRQSPAEEPRETASAGPDDQRPNAADGGPEPIDAANQEAALAAILSSPQANDGGTSRDAAIDLDFL